MNTSSRWKDLAVIGGVSVVAMILAMIAAQLMFSPRGLVNGVSTAHPNQSIEVNPASNISQSDIDALRKELQSLKSATASLSKELSGASSQLSATSDTNLELQKQNAALRDTIDRLKAENEHLQSISRATLPEQSKKEPYDNSLALNAPKESVEYVIKRGETFSSLSRSRCFTKERFLELNPAVTNLNKLAQGQSVLLPDTSCDTSR